MSLRPRPRSVDSQGYDRQRFGVRGPLEGENRAADRTIDRNRRSIRTTELVEAVQGLDIITDPTIREAALEWIMQEYENRQGGRLIGLFGKCYLGDPYIDHRLDLSGGMILEHYSAAQTPPPPFAAARPLARNDAYVYVEVYDDGSVIPVRADGQPVL